MLAEVRVAQGGQASTTVHEDADECLHCVIMELVEERVAAGDADRECRNFRVWAAIVDPMEVPDGSTQVPSHT
jgi:hypothetical protein